MDTSPAGGQPGTPAPTVVTGTDRRGDAVVIGLAGDVDALTAPQLTEAVSAALHERPHTVVVDLSRVDFLASAGLAALVESHRMAGPDSRLHIVATGSATLRPLTMTGLTDELAVFATSEEALAT
jgi:anti-anti-sigma factor